MIGSTLPKRIVSAALSLLVTAAMFPAYADETVKTNITSYTAPKAVADFAESDTPQPIVEEGTAEGGTMYYRLGLNGDWSTEVPTSTVAATHNVYWYVKGDETHNDLGSETAPQGKTTVTKGHNDKVRFLQTNTGFNIELLYAANASATPQWIRTTFNDVGYANVVKVGDNQQVTLTNFEYDKTYTVNGVEIRINAEIPPGSEAVSINYELKNTTKEDLTVQIASHADTKIGNNDHAHIYLENGDTIVMEDNGSGSTAGARYKITSGLGAFSSVWFGAYGQRTNHLFDSVDADYNSSGDSGVAWSWAVPLPAGEETFVSAGGDSGTVNSQSIKATGFTAVYGDTDKKVEAELTKGDGELTYSVLSGTDVVSVDSATGDLTIHKAGSAIVAIVASETENFERTTKTIPVRVVKKDVTVNWTQTEFEFDGEPHAPLGTVEGLVGADECTVISPDEKIYAGEYTSSPDNWVLSNNNYKLAKEEQAVSFTITKRPLAVSWSDTEFVYDGEPHIPSASFENYIDTETIKWNIAYNVVGEQTDSGTYTATAEVTSYDENNYTLPNDLTKVFSIEKADPGLSLAAVDSKTYGDSEFKLELSKKTDSNDITYKSSNDNVLTVDEDGTVNIIGAGSATLTASASETRNYKAGETSIEITVEKKAASLEVTQTEYNKTYGDDPFKITDIMTEGESPVKLVSDNKDVADIDSDGDIVIIGGGKANITLSMDESSNYKAVSQNVTVNVAPKEITLTAKNAEKKFGEEDPRFEFTADGLVEGDTIEVTFDREKGEQTGTYKITPILENNNNYTVVKAENGVLTITKGVQNISVSNEGLVYGNNVPVQPITANSGAHVVLKLKDGSRKDVISIDENGNITPIGAGEVTVTATVGETDSYTATEQDITIRILPKEISLDWSDVSFTYDGKPHKPTAVVKGLVGKDECAVTVDGEQTNAGSYKATAVSLSNPNYKLPTEKTKEFIISKADAQLKCSDITKNFGDEPFTLAVEKATDAPVVYTSSDESTIKIGSDGKAEIIGAGSAVITAQTEKTNNYLPGKTEFTITVERRSGGFSVERSSYDKIYGDGVFTLDGIKAEEGTVLTYSSNNENVVSVSDKGDVTINGVGTAQIIIKTQGGRNYIQSTAAVTVNVTKRKITISPVSNTKVYGQPDPEFTANIKGLPEGVEYNCKLVRTEGEVVGAYVIKPEFSDDPNYEITAENAIFTITKADQSVKAENITLVNGDTGVKVNAFCDTSASFIYSIKSGESVSVDAQGNITAIKPGETVVTVTAPETQNYNSASTDITITVQPRQFKVTFDYLYDNKKTETTVTEGYTIAKPSDDTRDGYKFEGWYSDPDFKVSFDFSAPVKSDMTLYAKWTESEITVIVDPDPDPTDDPIGRIGDMDGDNQISSGDALTILRISAGLIEKDSVSERLADVDQDNEVTSGDALDTLRYSIGMSRNVNILNYIY